MQTITRLIRPTRAQQLQAGDLVDVTLPARQHSFAWPVAVTRALFHDIAHVPPEHAGSHSVATRLDDVLATARQAIRHADGSGLVVDFGVVMPVVGVGYDVQLLTLRREPGDDGRPVITLLRRSES